MLSDKASFSTICPGMSIVQTIDDSEDCSIYVAEPNDSDSSLDQTSCESPSKVVLKIGRTKKHSAALLNEYNLLSKLDHPYIAKAEGLHKSKVRGAVKLTLPYLGNGDLARLIEEEDIDENLAKYLSHQMLTGLMYLHS